MGVARKLAINADLLSQPWQSGPTHALGMSAILPFVPCPAFACPRVPAHPSCAAHRPCLPNAPPPASRPWPTSGASGWSMS